MIMVNKNTTVNLVASDSLTIPTYSWFVKTFKGSFKKSSAANNLYYARYFNLSIASSFYLKIEISYCGRKISFLVIVRHFSRSSWWWFSIKYWNSFLLNFKDYIIFIYNIKGNKLNGIRIYKPQKDRPVRTIIANSGEFGV